jgi:predicted MFS family arabinose efflux permease
LGDRLGKFRIVAWATLACCVCSVGALLAGSLSMLVLARMAMGVATAAVVPLALAWIGDAVHNAQLQETIARVGVGTTLGAATGQLVGGLLTQSLGWRWAFAFMALLSGVVGVLLLREWRRQKAAAAPPSGTDAAPASGVARPSFFAQTWSILTGSWSRVVLLIAFVEGAAGMGALALWAAHLQAAKGLSVSSAGAVVALVGLGSLIYLVTARHVIPRLGQHGLTLVGGSLMGACALVVAYTPVWQLTLPASVLAGFGFSMFHITMQANAAQMAPGARGTAVSLFASALFLGQSAGASLASGLFDRVGSQTVVAAGGVVMIVLAVVMGVALRRRHRMSLGA